MHNFFRNWKVVNKMKIKPGSFGVKLLVFSIFGILVVAFVYLSNAPNPESFKKQPTETAKEAAVNGESDNSTNEEVSLFSQPRYIEIGTKAIKDGRYLNLEGGILTYEKDSQVYNVPVPSDGLLLECSEVPVKDLEKFNMNNIYYSHSYLPDEIGLKIKKDDNMLVMYDIGKDEDLAITIIVEKGDCPE